MMNDDGFDRFDQTTDERCKRCDKMKDEDERRIKSDKILNTSFLLLVFCFCCRARVLPGFTPWGKMSDFDWPK